MLSKDCPCCAIINAQINFYKTIESVFLPLDDINCVCPDLLAAIGVLQSQRHQTRLYHGKVAEMDIVWRSGSIGNADDQFRLLVKSRNLPEERAVVFGFMGDRNCIGIAAVERSLY